jgi:hypothetical protein
MENNEENLAPDQQFEMLSAEELEALTEAPQGQPIMPESEFSVEEARSPRPQWKRPLPKLALVAIVLCPVFAFIWMFFNGFGRHRLAKPPKPETTAIAPARSNGEIERLQEENARLKVGRALDDQSKIEEQLQQGRDKPQRPQPAATPAPRATPRSVPSTPRIAAAPQPIAPTPTRIQTAPSAPRPAPVARSTPSAPSRSVDPMERWQQLARLGSYGSISPEESTTPEFSRSEQVSPRVAQAMQNAPYKVASIAVPTAQIAPTSAVQSFQPEFSTTAPVERLPQQESESSASEVPEILVEEESRILNAELEPPNAPEQRAIAAGTHSPGEVTTPIVIDESGQSDRFTVRLDEPILDNRGQVAFPEETEFVVQVDRVSQAGQVHVSAIAANWSVDEQQQEITLPPNTIQVRGEDGEPLMAEHFDDRGGAIAGMDAGQFLLGAAGRAAELYTRSDSRVQTRGSSTVITESNPAPNIVAGIVEGGTDAVLESIQERNRRAIERMEEMPNVRYIESGTDVEVFVNQSMFMPR